MTKACRQQNTLKVSCLQYLRAHRFVYWLSKLYIVWMPLTTASTITCILLTLVTVLGIVKYCFVTVWILLIIGRRSSTLVFINWKYQRWSRFRQYALSYTLLSVGNIFIIFTFNKHFDKENDCVHEPVITKPNHWRRLFITFYIVNFLLFKNKNSTYLMK